MMYIAYQFLILILSILVLVILFVYEEISLKVLIVTTIVLIIATILFNRFKKTSSENTSIDTVQYPQVDLNDNTDLDLIVILEVLKCSGFSHSRWQELGLTLGLYQPTLDTIEANYPHDVSHCLKKCLTKWLNRADNVDSVGPPTWDTLADGLRRLDENAAAVKVLNTGLSCQILLKYDKKISETTFPIEKVQLIYSEGVIARETSTQVNISRALRTAVYKDHSVLEKFASILLRSENTVQLGTHILKDYNQTFHNCGVIPANFAASSSSGLVETINLEHVQVKDEFDRVNSRLGTMIFNVAPLIKAAIPSLEDLISYLRLIRPELRPQLPLTLSFKRVIEVIKDNCSISHIALLKDIVEQYKITEAEKLITTYKDSIVEFCNKEIYDVHIKHLSAGTLLKCDTIRFIVNWKVDECTLNNIEELHQIAFQNMKKRVEVVATRPFNSIAIICYAPHHLMDMLVVLAQENIKELKGMGLVQLTIGYYTVYNDERERERVATADLSQKLEMITKANQKQLKEIEDLQLVLNSKETDKKEIEALQEKITTQSLQILSMESKDKQEHLEKPSLETKKPHIRINQLKVVLNTLSNNLFPESQWKPLGLALGLSEQTLDTIQKPTDTECLIECLSKWLEGSDDAAATSTWTTLIAALREIGQKRTAEGIEKDHTAAITSEDPEDQFQGILQILSENYEQQKKFTELESEYDELKLKYDELKSEYDEFKSRYDALANTHQVSRNGSMTIHDQLYGTIEFKNHLLIKIIDTPQFQRLRNIKQLGCADRIFAKATHTRYQHSLGMCYLAEKFISSLKSRQPELGITDTEVLCIQVAALCYNLGHGPFSFLYNDLFLPEVKDTTNSVAENSIQVMEHMLKSNNGLKNLYDNDIGEENHEFIKELIRGENEVSKGDEKQFMFEIVVNRMSGLDVSMIDHISRDYAVLDIKFLFDWTIYILKARVLKCPDEKHHICVEEKHLQSYNHLFEYRHCLFRNVYFDRSKRAVDLMVSSVLVSASEHKFLKGQGGKKVALNETDDMVAFTGLTDGVLDIIRHATLDGDKERVKASLLSQLDTKKTFIPLGYIKLSLRFVAKNHLETSYGERNAFVENLRKWILNEYPNKELLKLQRHDDDLKFDFVKSGYESSDTQYMYYIGEKEEPKLWKAEWQKTNEKVEDTPVRIYFTKRPNKELYDGYQKALESFLQKNRDYDGKPYKGDFFKGEAHNGEAHNGAMQSNKLI